jgi:Tol biopolymer transport system component
MMIAAAVAIACVVALSAVSEKADAAFPGKNGRIAYNSNGVIYTINTDGTGKFRVTDNRMMEYDPSYSPDGKRLVFSADLKKPFPPRTYTVELYTIGVHGKNRVRLTNNSTYDYSPDYSPDGRRIAFSGSSEKHSGIYTINTRGGGKAKVAEGGDDPDYSPHGEKIVYYAGNDIRGKVYTINVGGEGKSKVTEGSNPS